MDRQSIFVLRPGDLLFTKDEANEIGPPGNGRRRLACRAVLLQRCIGPLMRKMTWCAAVQTGACCKNVQTATHC